MKKSETWEYQAAKQVRANKKAAAQASRVAREARKAMKAADRVRREIRKAQLKVAAQLKVQLREDRLRQAIKRAAAGSLSAAAFVIQTKSRQKIQTRAKLPKLKPVYTKADLKARLRALDKAAELRDKAKSSPPGQPPRTRKGLIRRSVLYAVDKQRLEAVIGPSFQRIGKAASAHEHGGQYKGQRYPQRPFMGPTLDENLGMIPQKFKGALVGP